MGIAAETVRVTLMISAPLLIIGMVVGLVVSIFQAVTQIQEVTLVFVPKIIAVLLAMILVLPWMMNIMIAYTQNLFNNIPMYVR